MHCPECGVRLYKTVTSTESNAYVFFEIELWVFSIGATIALLLLGLVFNRIGYSLGAIPIAILAFAAWRMITINKKTPSDWPRWTNREPW